MITEEQVEFAKEEFISMMTDNFRKNGGSNPVFALIVDDPQKSIPGIIVFPLPGELFNSPERKRMLVEKVLPEIKTQVIDDKGYKALASCFMMEANMWIQKKQVGEDISQEEIQNIRKTAEPTDIVMFNFEGKYGKSMFIYEVDKSSFITPEGELKETTELKLRPELNMDEDNEVVTRGIFQDLFKIFWQP